jgi:hypothetical protein
MLLWLDQLIQLGLHARSFKTWVDVLFKVCVASCRIWADSGPLSDPRASSSQSLAGYEAYGTRGAKVVWNRIDLHRGSLKDKPISVRASGRILVRARTLAYAWAYRSRLWPIHGPYQLRPSAVFSKLPVRRIMYVLLQCFGAVNDWGSTVYVLTEHLFRTKSSDVVTTSPQTCPQKTTRNPFWYHISP